MTIVIYNIVSIIIFFMLMYTYIHFSTYYKTKEFIMVSEVILFTYKSGEIDNFLNRFYSSSSFINNNSYIKLSFLNPNIFGFFAFKILSASFFMLSFINSIFCFWNHKNTHKKALAEID